MDRFSSSEAAKRRLERRLRSRPPTATIASATIDRTTMMTIAILRGGILTTFELHQIIRGWRKKVAWDSWVRVVCGRLFRGVSDFGQVAAGDAAKLAANNVGRESGAEEAAVE